MNTITTQAQKFAGVYAGKLAKRQLRTIAIVSIACKLITAGVAIISYRHQSGTLNDWEAPFEIAYGLPGLVDLLTIVCVLAISTPALDSKAAYIAKRVIAFPILISSAINFAGHGSIGVKLVALTMPIFIPLGELVANAIKPDFEEMDRIERAAYAVAAPASTTAEVDVELAARRSEAALKAAQTRRENKAMAEAKKADRAELARLRREARKLAEIAPSSPGHPAVILSPADKAVLEGLMS